jgi:hypothetical protein
LKGSGALPNKKAQTSLSSAFFSKDWKVSGGISAFITRTFTKKPVFCHALEDALTNTREDRLFLYVAAHGNGKRIGGLKSKTGMKLPAMLKAVRNAANYSSIKGVLIGFCSVTIPEWKSP